MTITVVMVHYLSFTIFKTPWPLTKRLNYLPNPRKVEIKTT